MTEQKHNLPSASSTRHISTLREWDKNPRSITKEGFDRLKRQLQTNKDRYGKYLFKPLLINEDGVVLGGNMRLKALKDLGVEDIDVSIVPTRTEQEMIDIALKDNDSAGKTEKDDLLALIENFPDLKLDDYAVHFDIPETLTDFMEQFKEIEEDEVPDVSNEPAVSEYGKVYQLGRHRLMCGDATKIEDVEKLMNGQKADMVFTDPPYGYKYESNHQDKHDVLMNDDKILDFLPTAFIATKDITPFYIFCGWQTVEKWIKLVKDNGLDLKNIIIWKKNNWSMGDLTGSYAGQYEMLLYCPKGRVEFQGGRDQDVWEFDRVPPADHPTMKPVSLVTKALSNHDADNILDLFGGSGTTLIACEQLERTCYMMELDEKYVDVVRRRWVKFTTGKEDVWQTETPVVL